jgi:hypothetical protein
MGLLMKLLLVRVLLITSLISFVLITTATPQEAAANASLTERAAGHTAEARIPDLLHQFNDSLRALAAKVSPAVVQITVTGFGSQDDKSKDGASFVIRQRAIGFRSDP